MKEINYSELLAWEREQIMFDGYGVPPTDEPTMADYVSRMDPRSVIPDCFEVLATNQEASAVFDTDRGDRNLITVLPWVVTYEGVTGILFPRPMSRITANTPTLLYFEREVMWAAYIQNSGLYPELGTKRWGIATGTGKTNWKPKSTKLADLGDYPAHVIAGVSEATGDAMRRRFSKPKKGVR